jgi:small subunit ribosomal protein S20
VANHKDAAKRARQAIVRRARNRMWRTRMRNQIKSIRALIAGAKIAEAEAMFPGTVSILQKIAGKGIIHKRNAARRISRLAHAINSLKAGKTAE